uniref:NADH dehydrogenase subunit 4L n=1 Tax=Pomphorhynchus bulbocolli TaxID=317556 RepID=A0A806H3Q5_9BILA|nr:NADH dehydrogenase subunit 4L [Pomphorhynchus bulbocolli]AFJ54189.1 NADH dehydrogenase subunit 4L [Pomphorhynchus bulbocolli]
MSFSFSFSGFGFEVGEVVGGLCVIMHIFFSKCVSYGGYVLGFRADYNSGGDGLRFVCYSGLKGLCTGITSVWGAAGVSRFIS